MTWTTRVKMAAVEIKDDIFEEIKILAKDFLDRSREDIDYPVKNPGDLETIGLRMVEVLFPKEYKEHYWRLMDAVKEELKKEGK